MLRFLFPSYVGSTKLQVAGGILVLHWTLISFHIYLKFVTGLMNSNEMPQSTDKTAITVIQILENSQPQVLTHEYLYTSVIKEAKYNLDLIPFQIKWIKTTQY